jgi:hypothetical protein
MLSQQRIDHIASHRRKAVGRPQPTADPPIAAVGLQAPLRSAWRSSVLRNFCTLQIFSAAFPRLRAAPSSIAQLAADLPIAFALGLHVGDLLILRRVGSCACPPRQVIHVRLEQRSSARTPLHRHARKYTFLKWNRQRTAAAAAGCERTPHRHPGHQLQPGLDRHQQPPRRLPPMPGRAMCDCRGGQLFGHAEKVLSAARWCGTARRQDRLGVGVPRRALRAAVELLLQPD